MHTPGRICAHAYEIPMGHTHTAHEGVVPGDVEHLAERCERVIIVHVLGKLAVAQAVAGLLTMAQEHLIDLVHDGPCRSQGDKWAHA